MACENESCQTFDSLSLKFSRLLYERNEKQLQQISSLLDELNNLNYKSQFVTNNNVSFFTFCYYQHNLNVYNVISESCIIDSSVLCYCTILGL